MKTDVLDPQYLREQNKKYGLFSHQFDAVLAAEEIKRKPEQIQFLRLLKSILEDNLHNRTQMLEKILNCRYMARKLQKEK